MSEQPITRAGEGWDRRAFTVDDVLRMTRAGIFADNERIELIDGELLPMNAEALPHVKAKTRINRFFAAAVGETIEMAPDATLYLSGKTYLEPDFYFWPTSLPLEQVEGKDLLLVVELSDSSLARDLKLKAGVYARHGVPEYWVTDLKRRVVTVHCDPEGAGWAAKTQYSGDDEISPRLMPHVAFRLNDHSF